MREVKGDWKLIGIHLQVNCVRVHRGRLLFLARVRKRWPISAFGSSARSDEAHGRTDLSLQSCHGISPFARFARWLAFLALGALLGALLATGDCLGSNEIDIGAVILR